VITAILAISDDGIIGLDGKLPWHLSADLRRFKQLTTNHAVIMGRKTFESIGRALPNRTNIVVSGRTWPEWRAQGIIVAGNPEMALADAVDCDPDPFVIGGASIYEKLWPFIGRIELTEVHVNVGRGIRFWPNLAGWRETARIKSTSYERLTPAERDAFPTFDFVTYDKR
jgi:dihydrofolate reductase